MTNGKKLINNAVWGQLPIIVQIISGLVLMPLMISYFGDRNYGLWVLASTFLGYFGILDFGLSNAIVRYVSSALGKGDKTESDGWITVGVFLLLISSVVGFLILAILLLGIGFINVKDATLIKHIFTVVGIAFILELPSKAFLGILRAHVKSYISDRIVAFVGIIRIITFFIALENEVPFIYFFYFLAISTVIQGGLIVIFALKIHEDFKIQKNYITKKNLKLFFDYSGFSFIAQLADILRFRAFPIIISVFLGLSSVTIFQVANRLKSVLGSVHQKVLLNLTPVFSQLEGKGDKQQLMSKYLFSYKLSTYFVSITTGLTIIAGPSFIYKWLGPGYSESITVLLFSLIGTIAAGIQSPTVSFLFGTSRHRFYAFSNSIEAVLILGSAMLLVQDYGLVGMVIGASASTVIVKFFIQPSVIVKELGLTLLRFHSKYTFIYLLKASLYLFVCFVLGEYILKVNYFSIILFGVIALTIVCPYLWWFGFSKNERITLLPIIPFVSKSKILTTLLSK